MTAVRGRVVTAVGGRAVTVVTGARVVEAHGRSIWGHRVSMGVCHVAFPLRQGRGTRVETDSVVSEESVLPCSIIPRACEFGNCGGATASKSPELMRKETIISPATTGFEVGTSCEREDPDESEESEKSSVSV